jgi:pyridoxal phosphate enzyme (YggS family)
MSSPGSPPAQPGRDDGAQRRAVIAARLAQVRSRIAAAATAAGRDPAAVTLIAVTKTCPATDVLHLAALGVPDIGENRDQEAAPKAAEVAASGATVRWHFVGRLQTNKCRSVARYADLVHAVDSVHLAQALDTAAQRAGRGPLGVLVQVSIDGDPRRGGALSTPDDPDRMVDRVAEVVAQASGLRLAGVMAVAPMDWDPAAAFARLAEISARMRAEHPAAGVVSAGMSGDFEAAVGAGATHVRVGSALLGNRPPLG